MMTNYTFGHWDIGGTNMGSANPATFGPITADVTITAIYTPVAPHTVTLASDPTGVVYTSPAGTAPFTVSVNDGGSITVQAPPQVVK